MDGKQPWIALNIDPGAAPSLLPSGFVLLPPTAFGDVRIGIKSVDDLHALHRIIFAAMQTTLEERTKPGSGG